MPNATQAPPTVLPKRRVNNAFRNLMSLHWWMAWAYLVLFVGGSIMAQLPREVSFRSSLYDFHKSIGILTIGLLLGRVLLLLRVWWRKYSRQFPQASAHWWRRLLLHSSLYGFMIVVPVTGILLSNSFRSNNVKFFGIVIPDIFPQNAAMVEVGRSLHFWLAYSFLMFVVVHTIDQWKVVRAIVRRWKNWAQTLMQNTANRVSKAESDR
ncbi:cytochrome b [Synechococcus elongatus]|uniref:Cytochrome b/b6 domain-containing protein n=1 Tax=Synechococcus elongatus PCC 11802 TaxID=2283154 RepID=A0AAT9JY33_SYNEL|nr:cytochrome b/b6 domain-containing protein [Synechococcus elongatus]QFZ93011.1 cytochrome b [Synechococcus elongatus PCC 11802]